MNKFTRHERINLIEGKSLTVENHTVHLEHPLHWHSFFEIEIILSGEGKYVINDIAYDISNTNVFLLTPTDFHYLDVKGDVDLINLSFDETMIDEKNMAQLIFSDISNAYSLYGEEYTHIVNASELLRSEYEQNGDCQKSLLQYVIKCLLRKNVAHQSELSNDESMRGIKKAIIYIQLHFRESIMLEQVATEAGYTPTYFSKLFKKATGESFTEMLTRYRTGYARTLLSNGFSVADACFSSGFGSLSNFSELFRRSFNMSPMEYKKRCNS